MSTAEKHAASLIKNVLLAKCDDWTALYVNGKKVVENHSLHEKDILEALGLVFEQIWLDNEWVEEHGMPTTTNELP